jgi:trypsin
MHVLCVAIATTAIVLALQCERSNAFFLRTDIQGMLDGAGDNTPTDKRVDTNADIRIIGGTSVETNEFPFFARVDNNHQIWCAGTLVAPEWVLTAGHCQAPLESLSVILNATGPERLAAGHIEVSVLSRIEHPKYLKPSYKFDAALLKLERSIYNIKPVQLMDDITLPHTGDWVTAIGLGVTSMDPFEMAEHLQKVDMSKLDPQDCQDRYRPHEIPEEIMICAMIDGGGKDACWGDSGGPLLDKISGKQVGITSFGYKCATATHPGVYSRVTGFKQWIDDTICQRSTFPPASCQMSPGSQIVLDVASRELSPPPTGVLTPLPSPVPLSTLPTSLRRTQFPTPSSTSLPTPKPTSEPTHQPTPKPTQRPTVQPTFWPTPGPTLRPIISQQTSPFPSLSASAIPSNSRSPTDVASKQPSLSFQPSMSAVPSSSPSAPPSSYPTGSVGPSQSQLPSSTPSLTLSVVPSGGPSSFPSFTHSPTSSPSLTKSSPPSLAKDCVDNPNEKFFFLDRNRDCKWLSKSTTKTLREICKQMPDATVKCCETCS